MDTTDFEKQHTFEVMASQALKGKAPGEFNWAAYYRTFQRVAVSPRQLAVHIHKGFAFTPVWKESRKEANFVSAGHIAFDFDTGNESSSLDYLMRDGSFAWLFASFAYATPSSTEEAPRSRVVYVLEYPIYNPNEYRTAYQAVAWKMGQDGSHCDPACKDPLRLYYGSEGCRVLPNWSVLGAAVLDMAIAEYDKAHPAVKEPPTMRQIVKQPGDRLQAAKLRKIADTVRAAAEGDGHNTLLKQAHLAGGYIATGSLNETEARDTLIDAALARGNGDSAKEIERIVRDGIAAGKKRPLHFETVSTVGSILS